MTSNFEVKIDESINRGEDFFDYVNKQCLAKKANSGRLHVMHGLSQEREFSKIIEIFKNPIGDDNSLEKKLSYLYKEITNYEGQKKLVEELTELIKKFETAENLEEIDKIEDEYMSWANLFPYIGEFFEAKKSENENSKLLYWTINSSFYIKKFLDRIEDILKKVLALVYSSEEVETYIKQLKAYFEECQKFMSNGKELTLDCSESEYKNFQLKKMIDEVVFFIWSN